MVSVGSTLMGLALGCILIQRNTPVWFTFIWYIGALMGLLGIVIPWVAKHFDKIEDVGEHHFHNHW